MLKLKSLSYISISLLLFFQCQPAEEVSEKPLLTIGIAENHSNYFSINGTPALLLGGSNNDNIFQDHPVEPQLDTLVAYGGNYIRCTLSSRDFANQWPYQQRGDAMYDLAVFSEAYWSRLDKFFKITQQKGIAVQLEIWDVRDYNQANNWAKHPFNPTYNINYDAQTSGLPDDILNSNNPNSHPFFTTVPELDNNETVLPFQRKLVEKLLSYTFKYNHILYCINNEFTGNTLWSNYWANFIKQKANEENKDILVTDMPGSLQNHALSQLNSVATDVNYDFAEISMQSLLKGEMHYQFIDSLSKAMDNKPLTLVKIFGGEQNDFTGTFDDGPERFWKNIFAGAAAVRFHQPPQGAGLNRLAQVNLKSIRMLTDSVDFFDLKAGNNLLIDRQENEVFCLAAPNKSYVLYYPGCGEVALPLQQSKVKVKWLNILNAQWEESYQLEVDSSLTLKSPCEGKWAVWIEVL
jgi:hypothetical protein